jgi:hypothetical protein
MASSTSLSPEEFMSVRNGIVLLLALSTLSLLVGCGSSSPTAVAPPSGGFSASNLNGTYVFSVSGTDVNGDPYAIVGTLTANGSGGITSGTIDLNDPDSTLSTQLVADSPISSSSTYKVGVDGRGQATLGTSTPFGTITLDFVLTSSSGGLVTEFDGNGSGSGTLDVQTAGVTPTGTYAFSFSGLNLQTDSSFASVGNFTLGSGGAITGLEDFNSGGIAYANQALGGQLVLGPSTSPSTVLSTSSFTDYTYDVYAIDATHLKFIEMDSLGTLSGDAYSQTSPAISGTLAFTLAGLIPSSDDEPFAAGGFIVTDGNGNITNASTEDVNEGGVTVSSPTSPINFSATYASAGSGRFTLNNFSGFIPSTAGETVYAAYPSSGGLLLLEIDDLGISSGAGYPQSSPLPTFASAQGYGLNLTGTYLGANTGGQEEEVDDIAEFTAATGGTLTGIIDENYDPDATNGSQFYDLALSDGAYTGPDSSGRYALSADAGTSSKSTLNGGFGLTFYSVDGTTFPFIESDSGQVATGVLIQQSSTSDSAAIAKSHMFVPRPLIRPHADRQKKK